MKTEKSCGFIVYKEEGNRRLYLIMQSINGDFGFPKGHMEQGESELETAIRELKEETGLSVQPVEGFQRQIEYHFPSRPDIRKQVVYFLGKCTADHIECQEAEVTDAFFVPMETALEMLTFQDTKMLLMAADELLNH